MSTKAKKPIDTLEDLVRLLDNGKMVTSFSWEEGEYVKLVGDDLNGESMRFLIQFSEDGEKEIELEDLLMFQINGELYEYVFDQDEKDKIEYIESQLSRLNKESHGFTIKISDSSGNSTNNITVDLISITHIYNFFRNIIKGR